MRLIDLNKFIQVREKLSLRVSLFYSVPFALLLFVLLLFSGKFLGGLILGLVFGGGMFISIFAVRKITHRGVERKRGKADFDNLYFDVQLKGEMGGLSIYDDKIKFINLTPGGQAKNFEIEINEDLFISLSNIEYTKLQALKFGEVKQAIIIIKDMPHGMYYRFLFYDIDGLYHKVETRINEVDKFNAQKHQ